MKKALAVLLMLAAVFTVFAQGAAEADAAQGAKTEKMELYIYTGGTIDECQALIDAFNVKYPNVKCQMVQDKSANIPTRIINGEEADVIILIAKENLDSILDYYVPYKTANDALVEDVYKDSEYRYYSISMPLQTIMYNTEEVKGDMIPKSWFDLADPKYKGHIVLTSPSTGSGYAQLYMLYKLSGDNLELAKKIAENGTTYLPDSTTGPAAVERGEFWFTLTGEKNVATAMAKGSPVNYLYPEEGTGRRVEGAGIIKNGKNLEAAKLFMDWLTSTDGAETLRSLGRRSVSSAVAGPDYLPALNEINFFEYNDAEAASIKKALQAEFNTYL
ncbi:MAG: extracellular solute-binding protein [Spirochaetales bacterium]|nr:extracellular solute-binding protein [Spirochaetales bacterium]